MNIKSIYLLAAMAASVQDFGALYHSKEEIELKPNERIKSRIKKEIQRPLHDYNINGVIISAPDKKTARKIYSRMNK